LEKTAAEIGGVPVRKSEGTDRGSAMQRFAGRGQDATGLAGCGARIGEWEGIKII